MTKTRIEWIDLVRAIAILTVLFILSSKAFLVNTVLGEIKRLFFIKFAIQFSHKDDIINLVI